MPFARVFRCFECRQFFDRENHLLTPRQAKKYKARRGICVSCTAKRLDQMHVEHVESCLARLTR